MSWLKQIWSELIGLFVDDGNFALSILVWLICVRLGASPSGHALFPVARDPVRRASRDPDPKRLAAGRTATVNFEAVEGGEARLHRATEGRTFTEPSKAADMLI